jgi:hypothetical protein
MATRKTNQIMIALLLTLAAEIGYIADCASSSMVSRSNSPKANKYLLKDIANIDSLIYTFGIGKETCFSRKDFMQLSDQCKEKILTHLESHDGVLRFWDNSECEKCRTIIYLSIVEASKDTLLRVTFAGCRNGQTWSKLNNYCYYKLVGRNGGLILQRPFIFNQPI